MGLEHGAEVTGGSIATGASMADASSYSLTFSASEIQPANFLSAPTAADPYAGVSSSVTIVVGTNS